MELDTKRQHAKAKLNTGHTEDNIKVQMIHGHGVEVNGTEIKTYPSQADPRWHHYQLKQNPELLMMIQK